MKGRSHLVLGSVGLLCLAAAPFAWLTWQVRSHPPQENAAAAAAPLSMAIMATVNGRPITADFERIMVEDLGGDAVVTLRGREQIANQLVVNELLVQQAVRLNLDQDPQIGRRVEMRRRELLADAYLRFYTRAHPVSNAQLLEEYEARRSRLAGAKEYSVRRILVRDVALAWDIIGQLQAGRHFEQLAEQFSVDPGNSRNYGGSLGWISLDNADKTLIEAVRGLAPGTFTPEPVHTPWGWEVLELDDSRDLRILPFEAVQRQLQAQLEQRQREALAVALRSQSKVIWNDRLPAATLVQR